MLYISILILILFTLLYIISVKKRNELLSEDLNKKQHTLYFLYPMAAYIFEKTGMGKLINKTEIKNKVRSLCVTDQKDTCIKLYHYKKLSYVLALIFAFSGLSLIISLQNIFNNPSYFDGVLTRPDTGSGSINIRLKFRMENREDRKDIYEDEIIIQNNARNFTDEEWNQILGESIPYLEREVLGENQSPDYIQTNLNFFTEIPNTGISVEWMPEDYRLVSASGIVHNEELTEEKQTKVRAILKYRDRKAEHTISFTVWPAVLSKKEKLYQKLKDSIAEIEKQSDSKKEWVLPEKLDDYDIKWEKPVSNPAVSLFMLGLVASLLIWFATDRDLDNKIRQRNTQMQKDYPEIVNKFCLFVNAGMTVKQAWTNICDEYANKKKQNNTEKRYVYEEMIITLYELKLGIPEVQAYERFGKRTGLLSYMKFSSLLVQNLKKGNKDMVNLLKAEAMEAYHERKESAKKMGEEASTKLLAPMVIMLFIVLIIIMVPAFMSFSI